MVLCLQNSFKFFNKDDVQNNSSQYTQSEILSLDRYCRKRYIELIPYLDHLSDFSRCLGKCSSEENVTTTDVVRNLNAQLCSSFPTSRFIHVGLSRGDENYTGTSETDCKTKKTNCISTSHFSTINESCEKNGKVSMVWANSVHDHIRQGKEIPLSVIAMEYGDQPRYDFGISCKLLSDSGIPFYVCPGTLDRSSLVGAACDSIDLIDDAVQSAVSYNALGILVADWSAYGNVTPVEVSMSALAAGAALSWNSKVKQESVASSLAKVLNLHVFQDKAGLIGEVLRDMCDAHKLLDPRPVRHENGIQQGVHPDSKPENAYLLLQLLLFPHEVDPTQLGADNVQKASRCLRKCQSSLSKVQMKCRRASTIVKVLNLAMDMALYSCRLARALVLARNEEENDSTFGAISSLPSIARTDLANRLLGIIDIHRRVWTLSKKPGGLKESVDVLQQAFEKIVPSSTVTV